MEDINSFLFKKKKNKSKINHSLNESNRGKNMFNISSEFINNNARTYFSEKNDYKLESLREKFNLQEKSQPIICIKENISSKGSRYKEGDNISMKNLKMNKKPNYLMKRYFIKDKSLTPQEKTFQNTSICPIYDFYNCNSAFSLAEIDNLLQYSSFPQSHNYYKSANKISYSKKNNNVNSKSQQKIYEMKKIINEKSNPMDSKEDIKHIDDDFYYNRKKDNQNIEGNSFSKLNSPPYKTNDYRHMNVNININNNSQNNNIYYQLPNIINNYIDNSNNNYFQKNENKVSKVSDYGNNDNYKLYKNIGEHNKNMNNFDFMMSQNSGYMFGENNKNNIFKNYYLANNLNNSLNNHNIINNALDYYRQNNNQNKINMNNHFQSQNSIYNQNIYLNQNQIDSRRNEINQLKNYNSINTNISNYSNDDYLAHSNNLNNILLNNLQNNDNINYNNFVNNNINLNNTNFNNPMANTFYNQNINNTNNINNFHQLQISLNENNNNRNSNIFNNQLLQSLNYNSQHQNNYLNNYYPYFSKNNDYEIMKDYINNNINQNDYIDESILYSLTPIQLAQQCHIISKTQNGCRYLQNIILKNPELVRNLFFPKFLEHIQELSNGQFSNYLIKKIFQFLSEDLILKLIQTLKPMLEQIGTNQYGTKVLQDLIDYLTTEKLFISFVNIIIPYVKILIIDLNGSHIIYKLIITKNKYVKIIENIICIQVKDIAITRKGCNFLKKYFDFANEKDLINIKKNILKNLNEIITDQYGNYVIQSILTKEGSLLEEDFTNEICKNIIFYSNNKFSSNAVEKCFENAKMKNIVLNQFLKPEIFEIIIMDEYGNYVIQKAIAKADPRRKKIMFQLLKPLIPNLKNKYFGQRLLSRLLLQCPDLKINV